MIYVFLLTIQICGTIFFIWQELPEFRQVVNAPGVQLPKDGCSDLLMVATFGIMQISFWIRLRHVRIPIQAPNMFLNHLFLFLGRLSFLFGSALFSVVVFRHVPELGPDTDIPLMARRGTIFLAGLFALFCASLEVERLGQAFNGRKD